MEAGEQKKEKSALDHKEWCEVCQEKRLHVVVYRDEVKVIIECGFCGFKSNRFRKGGARKIFEI